MTFSQEGKTEDVYLPRGSVVILHGEARYKWKHAIKSRKTDLVDKALVRRDTRVSLTFRRVIKTGGQPASLQDWSKK